ncbi:MAG: aminopeptidase P family protein [Candidatus Melainabacteria bacterium]|nr:aminopeptidase P family protein [Candidatus Melainabacteria bacterium]
MKLKTNSKTSHARLAHFQNQLATAQVDGCIIENPLDLFYFTGLKVSVGKLLVHKDDAILLVDGRYLQMAEENSPFKVFPDIPDKFNAFCTQHRIHQLGFDPVHTSYEHFLHLKKLGYKLVPISSLFKNARLIKDASEITAMKKSAALLWKGFNFIRTSLKKNITEKELSKKFEIFCLERGADKLSFEPIIAFGPNSAMPHYRSQNARLREKDHVLIDIGVVLNGYHSDMTRVIFPKKADPYISHLYTIVRRAQTSALACCRPGVKLKELDIAARKVFRDEKVEPLFVHSLGHGIGLETHEFPRLKYNNDDKDILLQPGMVFTVEPGLYVPGKGGVRYEDTVVITEKSYTNFYPKNY